MKPASKVQSLYWRKTLQLQLLLKIPLLQQKIICDFAKENKALTIKAGVLDGQVIDEAAIKALAELPPKEVLIAKMLGSMNAPISGFVNVLQGTIRNVVYALEAVRQQKESA